MAAHIHTIMHHELMKTTGAWPAFAALEWKTRCQVLALLDGHAVSTLIETNGQAAAIEREVIRLTGSLLLGEIVARSLRKWTTRAE